jgi:ATP-dependent RNA helicase DDX3X
LSIRREISVPTEIIIQVITKLVTKTHIVIIIQTQDGIIYFLKERKNNESEKKESKEIEIFGEKSDDGNVGINFDKYDDIPVDISGEECPDPISNFEDSGIPESLLKNIVRAKYKKPTPVQKYSFSIVTEGRDLMACAQTGSGKTCAFLLPIVSNLIKKGLNKIKDEKSDNPFTQKVLYPTCLVLSPIRELSIQIYDEARKFAYQTGIVSQVIYGGEDISLQIRRLKSGCDILVATPGRLIDFIEKGRISLKGIKYLVLDEADRMLDMGFEDQIRQIIDEEDMPKNRQTLMFSATFPKEIQQLAADFLDNYIFLAVGKVGSTSNLIKQNIEYVEESEKFEILLGLIKSNKGKTLVFVEKKKNAEDLEFYLGKEGINAESIHGDRTQQERIKALSKFKEGKVDVLVATSVAARGLGKFLM